MYIFWEQKLNIICFFTFKNENFGSKIGLCEKNEKDFCLRIKAKK